MERYQAERKVQRSIRTTDTIESIIFLTLTDTLVTDLSCYSEHEIIQKTETVRDVRVTIVYAL
jgi:hypothetical protein